MSDAKRELFPATHRSWIDERIDGDADARLELNRFLIDVYAGPLAAYLGATSFRGLGDPHDLVVGFLTDRLARPEFLERWSTSGKALRRWLCNGLLLYAREMLHERERASRGRSLQGDPSCGAPSPEEACDRAFALAVVREAMQAAAGDLEARGLCDHFTVFLEHHAKDVGYRELAERLGVTPDRAAAQAKTARHAFVRALRRILARDAGASANVDQSIQSLLEALE